jgi:hypothetical protein
MRSRPVFPPELLLLECSSTTSFCSHFHSAFYPRAFYFVVLLVLVLVVRIDVGQIKAF